MFKKINILRFFFDEPTREFNIREMARISKIAPATASKDLKLLMEENLLSLREERGFKLYKANIENDTYLDAKKLYSIRKIKESGLINELNKFYLKPVIVLFGSCASGMDTETSDVDLLVISENNKDFPSLKKFEKKLGKKLQIFVVKNIDKLKNKHLINNILNGTNIQGKIKWI